jgi:hypothetical protein
MIGHENSSIALTALARDEKPKEREIMNTARPVPMEKISEAYDPPRYPHPSKVIGSIVAALPYGWPTCCHMWAAVGANDPCQDHISVLGM